MLRLTQEQALAAIGTKEGLSGKDLSGLDFSNLNLNYIDFRYSDLQDTDFTGSYLVFADFAYANLSGVDFTGAKLSGVIGLASKEDEMREAQRILQLLEDPRNKLLMDDWHTCDTTHCLAGWSCPQSSDPSIEASRKLPTLTKYFFEYNDKVAFEALLRVASGEESVWNTVED